MMSNQITKRTLSLLTAMLFVALATQARELPSDKKSPKPKPSASALAKMMECEPPVAYTEFALNNVRFGLEAGGQIWELNGNGSYEVPKVDPTSGEPSIHSLYAGALWIGGKSPDGLTKLAAVTYRGGGGTDFFNGPLSTNGQAEADFCNQPNYNDFDQHFRANLNDVLIHNAYHEALDDPLINVDELFPDGYSTPDYFDLWPGYNSDPNYATFLAPFIDYDGNGIYEPDNGDYPAYDLNREVDCRTRAVTDPVPLFGDETLWWVFNDNGGIHTETGGEQIGIEIQAQAFAYNTTDEINNMTFYNYVLINRGVQTLTDCYFGQWVDPDLGCPTDDYVGCDVQRGLSYTINGTNNDASCDGVQGYDLNPPAVGVDFFEGPYQDPDGINNPLSTDIQLIIDERGIPYSGLGIGYEDRSLPDGDPEKDNIIDNERFGMRRFVYYNRSDQTPTPHINGEPNSAADFYNYLDGKWKNGEFMTYGGNGVGGTVVTDFMFPGTTDPVGFATDGQITDGDWTESGEGNQAGDRRFIQSAGTFQLDPGEFNNVTVGVVWARPFADVETTLNALRIADDKAQSLFDNCFQILSGPDAPDVTAQELDREVILYISNDNTASNNYLEGYGFPSDFAFDPLIPGVTLDGVEIPTEDKYYNFQGYKVFQLLDASVSSAELDDINRARLVAQSDIQDGVIELINWVDDPTIGMKTPVQAVDGENAGIRHSYQFTEDAFSNGGGGLVNYTKYYYMVVAYANNEYESYDPTAGAGQALPYLESRKSASGEIPVITVIPHDPTVENSGTQINSAYGDIVPVTRIEGEGNGGLVVDITEETTTAILEAPYNMVKELEYANGGSPISIQVVDPLEVKDANYRLGMIPVEGISSIDDVADEAEIENPNLVRWFLIDTASPEDTLYSNLTIDLGSEQIISFDGEARGISISLKQYNYRATGEDGNSFIPDFLEATLTYDDPTITWLSGISDNDQNTEQNWIRSGGNQLDPFEAFTDDPNEPAYFVDKFGIDVEEIYENVLNGTVSPWVLGAQSWSGPAWSDQDWQGASTARVTDLNNVDVKFTDDKSKWTRVPVLEMQHFSQLAQGEAEKLHTRISLSVDKNGKNQLNGGDVNECTMNGMQVVDQEMFDDFSNTQIREYKRAAWPTDDPNDDDLHEDEDIIGLSFGFGWFPGYAIDVETGERLNMAFGENSGLPLENGRDMIWNPTDTEWAGQEFNPNNARFGGMHYWYVFRNDMRFKFGSNPDIFMPQYDNAQFIYSQIFGSNASLRRVFRACAWVGLPLIDSDFEFKSVEDGLIPSDALIRLRIAKPYARLATVADIYEEYLQEHEDDDFPYFYWSDEAGIYDVEDFEPGDISSNPAVAALDQAENDWMPLYEFSTSTLSVSTNVLSVLDDLLDGDQINVVPNPYYGGGDYDVTSLDNRVKIINLPADRRVTIRIYNTGGVLVRTLEKDNPDSFVEWDLKNQRNVPIAGGVHIFHIDVDGVGEKVVKWFGVMRPIDLDTF